jgi:hypothetical protein
MTVPLWEYGLSFKKPSNFIALMVILRSLIDIGKLIREEKVINLSVYCYYSLKKDATLYVNKPFPW